MSGLFPLKLRLVKKLLKDMRNMAAFYLPLIRFYFLLDLILTLSTSQVLYASTFPEENDHLDRVTELI